MRRSRVWPRLLEGEYVGRLFDDDIASLGKCLLVFGSKVPELACRQMLPRTLALDAVRQTVKTGFHKDEVAVILVHRAGDAISHLMPVARGDRISVLLRSCQLSRVFCSNRMKSAGVTNPLPEFGEVSFSWLIRSVRSAMCCSHPSSSKSRSRLAMAMLAFTCLPPRPRQG